MLARPVCDHPRCLHHRRVEEWCSFIWCGPCTLDSVEYQRREKNTHAMMQIYLRYQTAGIPIRRFGWSARLLLSAPNVSAEVAAMCGRHMLRGVSLCVVHVATAMPCALCRLGRPQCPRPQQSCPRMWVAGAGAEGPTNRNRILRMWQKCCVHLL